MFLLQDTPRSPDIRVLEVREALIRTLFRFVHIYRIFFASTRHRRLALRAAGAGPLIIARPPNTDTIYQGTRYCSCIAPQLPQLLRSIADDPDYMLLAWASSLRANARPGHTVERTFFRRSSTPRSWHSKGSNVCHTRLNSTYIAICRYC